MSTYTFSEDTNLCDFIDGEAAYDSGDTIIINTAAVVTIDRSPVSALGNITIDDGQLLVDGANATDPIHIWGKYKKAILPAGSNGKFVSTVGWYTHASTGDGTASQSISWSDYWSGDAEAGDFTDLLHGIWMEDTVQVSYGSESGTTPSVGDWIEDGSDIMIYGRIIAIDDTAKTIQIENWSGGIASGTVLKVRQLVELEGPQVILGWTATTTSTETLVTGVWTPMARLTERDDAAPAAAYTQQTGQGYLMNEFSDTMTFPYKRPRNGAHFRANMITVGTVVDEAGFDLQAPRVLDAAESNRYDFSGSNAGTVEARGINFGTGFGGISAMGQFIYEYCSLTGAGGNGLGKQMEMRNSIIAPDPREAMLKGTKLGSLDSLSGYLVHDTLLILGDAESDSSYTIATSNNLDFRRCTFRSSKGTGADTHALKIVRAKSVEIRDCDIGAGIQMQTVVNGNLIGNKFHYNADGLQSSTTSTAAVILELLVGCDNVLVKDMQILTGPAGRVLNITDSFNITIRCINSPDFPALLNTNRTQATMLLSGVFENIDIARVYFDGTTTGSDTADKAIQVQRTGLNVTALNIHGAYLPEWEPYTSNLDARSITSMSDGGINTNKGMEVDMINIYGNMFSSTFSSNTVGNLCYSFRDVDVASATHFTVTGDYYFDRRGKLGMYDGAVFEYTQQEFALGHTGFTGNLTIGTTNSSALGVNSIDADILLDFQYDIGSGFNGVWLDADTPANLTGITIDPDIGVKMKWRLANNDGVLREFNGLVFGTTTTLTDQQILYPIDQNLVPLKISAFDASDSSAVEGARVYLTALAGGPATVGDVILTGLTDSNGELSNPAFLLTADQPVTGRIRKSTSSPLYKTGLISGTIIDAGLDLSAFLVGDE